jgi:SOS-response transcriptional repressor LexA
MGYIDMNSLTLTQQSVLGFMHQFFADNDQLPPMHAIAKQFGWASTNAAHEICAQLERRGYIEKNVVRKYRFVRVKNESA